MRVASCVRLAAEAWAPFRVLQQELNTYVNRPTRILQLRDISPLLASLKALRVPVPGQTAPLLPTSSLGAADSSVDLEAAGPVARGDYAVTIDKFGPTVEILRTKTKPKKLTMVGSDGRTYTFLLKGSEDLHLDERIMQLFSIVNQLLASHQQSRDRLVA